MGASNQIYSRKVYDLIGYLKEIQGARGNLLAGVIIYDGDVETHKYRLGDDYTLSKYIIQLKKWGKRAHVLFEKTPHRVVLDINLTAIEQVLIERDTVYVKFTLVRV